MKFCPLCKAVYNDADIFFCTEDGNRLVENNPTPTQIFPHTGGNPLPNTFNPPPPTVQIGQSNFPPLNSETVTVVQPQFVPPIQSPQTASNSNKNIIIAVFAALFILVLAGAFILNSSKNSAEAVSNPATNSKSEDNEKNTEKETVADDNNKRENSNLSAPTQKPKELSAIIPNNTLQQYSGTSRFPNKTLPLTLRLTRNGQNLSGSAETPGEVDELSGSIKSDGSFSLSGFNLNTGQVTGVWNGKISESGQISGVWTSINGRSKVGFSARRVR